MTAVRQTRGEATRFAILEAAERQFADVGFAEARLEDVAEAVGIRRPSVLYYFASKQELYDAVEEALFASMHAIAQDYIERADTPFARLLALLDAWLDFNVARPTAARIIQRLVADVSPRRGNPVEYSDSALADIDRIVGEGVASGAFRPVAPIQVMNSVAGSVLFYVCNGRQVGEQRGYDPSDPAEIARFRELLHRIAAAAVLPPET